MLGTQVSEGFWLFAPGQGSYSPPSGTVVFDQRPGMRPSHESALVKGAPYTNGSRGRNSPADGPPVGQP